MNSCKKDNIDLIAIRSSDIIISKWYNGANSAISFMWDDTQMCHYTEIAPTFNTYGYCTSFSVNTDILMQDNNLVGYEGLY